MRDMRLAWPVARSTPITQRFGENPGVYARFGLAGHNGLDFGIPVGTAVLAAAHGVVDRVVHQADDGYGRHVRLRHAGGALTIYAHLDSAVVETGQEVKAGAVLGASGNSGFSTGPHLHFELRLPGEEQNGFGGAVDPLPLLDAAQSGMAEEDLPGGIGKRRVTSALNLRLQPSFGNTVRGCLSAGDVVVLAGPQQVSREGFHFVPVLLWVAEEYLQPAEEQIGEIGLKLEDFHIIQEFSTVFDELSTGFHARRLFVRPVFPH